jgi:PKD repeat protein
MKKIFILTALLLNIVLQTNSQSAYFTSDSPTCLNDTMHFTPDPPGGNIVQELWDFGDGTVVTFLPPATFPVFTTHLYPVTGIFTVTRTVKFDTGILFYSIQVQSIANPLANFTYSAVNCIAQPVQFTDLSLPSGGSIQLWSWNFGDPLSGINNTSSMPNPSHIFSSGGTFNVSLTVTTSNGCVNTIVKSIPVSIAPVADFTVAGSCAGSGTQFTDMSVANAPAIVSHYWDFGDGGISSQTSPTHIYSNYGIYMATLTVVNSNGCSHSVTKPVTVNPNPTAFFSFPTLNCIGDPVQFTDLSYIAAGFSGYIIKWVWDFGDGTPPLMITFPNSPNVTHTFAGIATAHVVRLTVTSSSGCSGFIEKIVYSTPAPVANFSHIGATCENQPVQFIDLSQTNGAGVIQSWHWNFGDPISGVNNNATTQNPVHTYSNPGVFFVTLSIVNLNGCADTISKVVSVNQAPYAYFIADTVYQGTPTTFLDLSATPAGIIVNYLWDFGDGQTSTLSNPVHIYAASGNYFVTFTVTNSNGCTADTTKEVLVLQDPLSGVPATRTITNVIVGNGQTKCYNATQVITTAGNGTLFYILPGGNATLIAGQKITLLPTTIVQPGSYFRGYIAPNGPWCAFPSMPAVTSADDQATANIEQSSFRIYPNPTSGIFVFELREDVSGQNVTVEVFGTMGEKVMTENLYHYSKRTFSLTGMPAGIYVIRMIRGDRSETVKIIKH